MLEEKPNVAFQHDRTSSYVEDEVTTFMNRQFPERYFGLGGTSSCSLLLSVLNTPPPFRLFSVGLGEKIRFTFPRSPVLTDLKDQIRTRSAKRKQILLHNM